MPSRSLEKGDCSTSQEPEGETVMKREWLIDAIPELIWACKLTKQTIETCTEDLPTEFIDVYQAALKALIMAECGRHTLEGPDHE
jgi:hypothetical protein